MSKPVKWYEIEARTMPRAEGEAPKTRAELYIYGNIGDRWYEDGVIASELVKELADLDVEAIDVRINSYGGSVSDGMAIYNALRRHKAEVNTWVDGVAISCASYIAMAGQTVTMAKNAQMMIHAPWCYAVGNAPDMREMADILDRYGKAMAHAYADKSGKSYDDALALLTDGKDHWFSPEEALAEGFADAVGEQADVAASLARSFDLSRFQRAPAAKAASVSQPPAAVGTPKEHSMPEAITPAAEPQAVPVPKARTKADNERVLAMFKPFAHRAGISDLKDTVLADPEMSMETISARLIEALGRDVEPLNPQGAHPRVETVEDEADKRRAAAAQALLVRAGVETSREVRAQMGSNPFRGRTLMEMARMAAERAGVRTDGMDKMAIVGAAFTQSTSDFPVLLENAMHKALQAAYAAQPLTWNRFCATGSVSDFRAHTRYRTGSFGDIDAVNELGEFINKTIPDGEKASITAATKGNIINLSRQAIINDDLGAFVGLAAALGRAAARTVENDVYALLKQNTGQGPSFGGAELFSATHNNYQTTGSGLAVATLDAARALMASQTDVTGNDYLDLRPSVLLVPMGLGGTARVINEAEYDPDTSGKLQRPNMVRGLVSDIVDTPRLSGAGWYLFADPSVAPVIEVAFLDGNQEPFLDRQDGFDVDGTRYKVRLDYGVAPVDYRGGVFSTGAAAG